MTLLEGTADGRADADPGVLDAACCGARALKRPPMPARGLLLTALDKAGAGLDSAGATLDRAGAALDKAGATLDTAGAALDTAGATLDIAGTLGAAATDETPGIEA